MIRIILEQVNQQAYEEAVKKEFEVRYGVSFESYKGNSPVTIASSLGVAPIMTPFKMLDAIKKDITPEQFTTRECLIYLDSVMLGMELRLVVADADGSNIRAITPDNCRIDLVD